MVKFAFLWKYSSNLQIIVHNEVVYEEKKNNVLGSKLEQTFVGTITYSEERPPLVKIY